MAALLNSLQMGFKTLAIQKRSSEVWDVLSSVKSEFETFGTALEQAQTRINQAGNALESLVGVRTRQIQRKLRSVTTLPEAAPPEKRWRNERSGPGGGRPGRYFAAALRFARTTGHTGIDVSAGGGRSAPRKKGANTMCGRYQFSWEESRMLARIREAVRKAGAQAPRE